MIFSDNELNDSKNSIRQLLSQNCLINVHDFCLYSTKKQRCEHRLFQVREKLVEARINRRENDREARFREALEGIMQVYSGVYGRLSDLIKSTKKRYEIAVSVVLGRHNSSIVVKDEKTARECISVCL